MTNALSPNLLLDGEEIEIVKTNRRGSIGLKVEPNRVALMVPKQFSDLTLASLLENEKEWLLQQIRQHKAQMPNSWQLKSGHEILWFGEKILYKEDHHSLVKGLKFQLEENVLTAFCKTKRALKDPQKTLKQKCAAFYSDALSSYVAEKLPQFANQINVHPTDVTIRDYKSRWGSCYPDGRIQYNWRLAMAPKAVIDYVMIHELCHLIHPNHSANYWALVAQHEPNYAMHKAWLKQHGTALIHFLRND